MDAPSPRYPFRQEKHVCGLIPIFTLQETVPKAQQCWPPLSFIFLLSGTGDGTQGLANARQVFYD